MKFSISFLCTAVVAAGLGWLAGALLTKPAEEGRLAAAAGQHGGNGPGPKVHTGPPGGWSQKHSAELAAVRAVPGASSETAWVQWAMGIADTEIPEVVTRLNPLTDLHALRYLYARWTRLDPKAAWASFCQSGIPRASNRWYAPTPDERPQAGLNSYSLSEAPRSGIAARMLVSWKAVDPKGAESLLAKLKDPGSSEAAALGVSAASLGNPLEENPGDQAWTATQCAAKAAEAEALPPGESRHKAIMATLQQWGASDAPAAGEWLKRLPDSDRESMPFEILHRTLASLPFVDRAQLLEGGMAILGDSADPTDFDSPSKNFDPFAHDQTSNSIANSLLKDWAAKDPAAMRSWLNALPEGKAKANLTANAAVALVGRDQEAAVSLLNSMEGDQQQALKTFMAGWAASDAAASLAWAGKIEDGPTRDNCLATAAAAVAGSDPALAMKSAQGISDPELRRRIFSQVENQLSWNPAALAELRRQFPDDRPPTPAD